eukprot:3063231-Rhodomonas_salina.2
MQRALNRTKPVAISAPGIVQRAQRAHRQVVELTWSRSRSRSSRGRWPQRQPFAPSACNFHLQLSPEAEGVFLEAADWRQWRARRRPPPTSSWPFSAPQPANCLPHRVSRRAYTPPAKRFLGKYPKAEGCIGRSGNAYLRVDLPRPVRVCLLKLFAKDLNHFRIEHVCQIGSFAAAAGGHLANFEIRGISTSRCTSETAPQF